MNNRPSRLQVAGVYSKRIIRWKRNSFPYLSGDAFSDAADLSVFPPKFRNRQPSYREVEQASVIFCDSRKLLQFFSEYHGHINAKVVIAGNSDEEFFEIPTKLPGSIKRLYLQNSFISDNKFTFTLPIGIENFRWGVNGHPRLMSDLEVFSKQHEVILFGPFGKTHQIRTELIQLLESQAGPWILETGRIKPKVFARLMSSFGLVGAVRGNGVDTHRLWEALYRGTIPIVKQDVWAKSLDTHNLPIIKIQDWTSENLNKLVESYTPIPYDPKSLPALWMPYWIKHIGEVV
jgi:hypothetical protein